MARLAQFALCCVVALGLSVACSNKSPSKQQDDAATARHKALLPVDAGPSKAQSKGSGAAQKDGAAGKRESTDFDLPAVIE